jgi:hypothetical protein
MGLDRVCGLFYSGEAGSCGLVSVINAGSVLVRSRTR